MLKPRQIAAVLPDVTRDDILRLDLSNSPLPSDDAVDTLTGLISGGVDPLCGFETVIDAVRRRAWHIPYAERVMLACNEVLGTYGVEVLYPEGIHRPTWEPVASYCDPGCSDEPTILYCHLTGKYMVTSWGDYHDTTTEEG